MLETITTGGLYNIGLALVAFLFYRLALRALNKKNGYTIDQFIQEARNEKAYNAIAILFGSYGVAAALLFGLVIS